MCSHVKATSFRRTESSKNLAPCIPPNFCPPHVLFSSSLYNFLDGFKLKPFVRLHGTSEKDLSLPTEEVSAVCIKEKESEFGYSCFANNLSHMVLVPSVGSVGLFVLRPSGKSVTIEVPYDLTNYENDYEVVLCHTFSFLTQNQGTDTQYVAQLHFKRVCAWNDGITTTSISKHDTTSSTTTTTTTTDVTNAITAVSMPKCMPPRSISEGMERHWKWIGVRELTFPAEEDVMKSLVSQCSTQQVFVL